MSWFENLQKSTATESKNISLGLFAEVCNKKEWRCYSSAQCAEIDKWVRKFVDTDARVPSPFGGLTLAMVPLSIIEFPLGKSNFKGWIYVNGAVMVVSVGEEKCVFLFIDNELAVNRKYPEDYFSY